MLSSLVGVREIKFSPQIVFLPHEQNLGFLVFMMKYKRREAMGGTGGFPPNFLYFTFIIETLGGSLPCLP